MNRLIIIGAGGHGKVVADNAAKNGYTEIAFVDDSATGNCIGFPIVGRTENLYEFDDGNTDFIIGIGNIATRIKIAQQYDLNWATLVHPSAQIALHTLIGRGTVIMAGAVINACAQIGDHCIINTCAVIEHDDVISDYVHISPNVALGGMVRIGSAAHIGIGATVSNNIDICSHCIIGAGAVIVRDITVRGTYVGVPVRRK